MRVIRDSKTHLSKGFCYVKFQLREDMMKMVDQKVIFQKRKLRISKARKNKV